MTHPDRSFSEEIRIKNRKEFMEIQGKGKKSHSKNFLVAWNKQATNDSQTRIGITVSKKVDKRAVTRNKIKRRIREIFRCNKSEMKLGVNIVIIARKSATELEFQSFKEELLENLRKAGIMSC